MPLCQHTKTFSFERTSIYFVYFCCFFFFWSEDLLRIFSASIFGRWPYRYRPYRAIDLDARENEVFNDEMQCRSPVETSFSVFFSSPSGLIPFNYTFNQPPGHNFANRHEMRDALKVLAKHSIPLHINYFHFWWRIIITTSAGTFWWTSVSVGWTVER